MRGLEPRLSKYLTVKYKKKQNRLIKHRPTLGPKVA